MASSPLFLVPFEIRQIIYEYYLSFTDDDFVFPPSCLSDFGEEGKPISTTLPNLMLTCKRAYAELQSNVHSTAAIRVICTEDSSSPEDPCFAIAAHGILRFERLCHLNLIVETPACMVSWAIILKIIMSKMLVLEYLTIDWGADMTDPDPDLRIFFEELARLASLRKIWIYRQTPGSYKHEIQQKTNGTDIAIKTFPYRWWR